MLFETCEELLKLNNKKMNKLIKKWEKDLNRRFTRENIQLAKKHMKSDIVCH